MSHTSKLDHAKKLADHGFSVIPVNAGDKIPCVKWTPYTSRTATDDELGQWFSNFPERNIGVVTGAVSGVVVVDVDQPEAFHIDMPRTPTAKTGKGLHYYFKYRDVGNAKLPFGDLKSDGGYVVAPPSTHASGSAYEWLAGLSFDDVPLAELPSEVIALTKGTSPSGDSVPMKPHRCKSETTPYGLKAMRDEREKLARVKSGDRNNQLNIAANKLGSLMATGDLSHNDAMGALFWACKENGLWHDDSKACARTIQSGLASGLRNPREKSEPDIVVPVSMKPGSLVLQRLSDVEIEKIDWLWSGVLARGKLTLFAGEGGIGKSTAVSDIAARVTTGSRWPASDDIAEAGDVVLIQLEDELGDTVLPRFLAAGGDASRVITIRVAKDAETGGIRPLNLIADMSSLMEQLKGFPDLKLIVIDPIMGYMGNLNSDKAAEVRKLTTPLQLLAQETNAAVLIVAHTNKSQEQNAVNSVQGSAAFTQAVRCAFRFTRDELSPGRYVMASMKNNLSKGNVSWGYSIETRQASQGDMVVETSGIVWEADTHRANADDILRKNRDSGKRIREAVDFLLAELADGPVASADIRSKAQSRGIAKNTLYRAADDLGIPRGAEGSLWALPFSDVA